MLTESLSAPYTDGFAFVQERRHLGGWAAVDAAFRDLPVSTEQILHPEKYDAHELPIPVAVPPMALAGAPTDVKATVMHGAFSVVWYRRRLAGTIYLELQLPGPGTVSLLGPLRMDYEKALRAVRSAAYELSRFVEEVYADD